MASSKSNVLTGIIIALLGVSGFLGYKYSKLSTSNNQQFDEIAELQKFQAELDGEYQVALSSLENMKNDNQELNGLIESQKMELKSQKSKINDLIWTKRELDKAKSEMANLNQLTQQYLGQINQMKQENELLVTQNAELTESNTVLTTSLQSEKEVTAQLEVTKTRLMSENQSLNSNNSDLSEKVDIASAVKLDEITFLAGSINEDGSFKKRIRKKKMDVFQTCFVTRANLVTEPGEEIFMVRVIDQNGQTLTGDENATVINKLNGEEARYSTSGKMEYSNEQSKACINWDPSFEIQKGEYTVEVYNKGYKVGTSNFKI
tara:strand:+ start:921 stop:1877 length:957 start_codon:yes stop_codon:yes gene_type:complete